ncbi:MIP18 family protein At1g68310 [Babesia microti strain RI]|uniref:MIP18 family protein At1g68310 n=1 Tax=Babesia microti (strain RI) TaxID=1133968 RepID=A0A1N6LXU0_BABMR|nr:MIP18 family protein At1g68310 [Babesia microti strain RI]SIO73687.1 MIP18 family protein At1g68310 [Babesia microti strain RI]|eukprot:XP_021337755.1 MIP18 family protein At1g68310 [Babesia microti strain RI]
MIENPNPSLIERSGLKHTFDDSTSELMESFTRNDSNYDHVDIYEVFDLIRDIKDPEHPYSIECLKIVDLESVKVETNPHAIRVTYRPTIPHCSQATLIGLMIYMKIRQNVPMNYKIFVQIEKGYHDSEEAINKQLADKERVSAALENPNLMNMIDEAIYGYVPPDIIDLSI